VIYDTLL
jgi:hypothetical protein